MYNNANTCPKQPFLVQKVRIDSPPHACLNLFAHFPKFNNLKEVEIHLRGEFNRDALNGIFKDLETLREWSGSFC